MKWQVTRTTDSIHVGKLIAMSPSYTRAGPPRCILGLHPGNVLQNIPIGENPAMAQTLETSFLKFMAIIQPLIQDSRLDSSPQGLVDGLDPVLLGPF